MLLVVAMAVAFFTGACGGRVNIIPEVSNALLDEAVGDPLKDVAAGATVIAGDSNLVLFTPEGKIHRFNLENRMRDFLVDLAAPIEPGIIHQKDIVVLKEKNTANFIFFDLREMKVIEMQNREKINADKIIGVDTESKIIGYVSGATGQRLVFMHYPTGKILAETVLETEKGFVFYNSAAVMADDVPKTIVLTDGNLFIFDQRRNSIETVKLEHKACSGFLADGGSIYYGSENRELVKFSLASRKVQWRFKLADQLKIEPRKAGPYIVITPEDHNIYFFNKRGTLYWWEKLDSTRLLPPVIMKENVAVFLWNKAIKFLDYKNKTAYSYPFDKSVSSDALHIGEYLYVLAETGAEDPEQPGQPLKAITKIGNNFGVVIRTDPQNIIPLGRSIKFNLEKFNLVKPELNVKILDTENENVFAKTIAYKDDPSFVWIPNRAMAYKLVVEINAENKKGLIIEHPFEVIDVEKLLSQYYYRLQKNNNEDPVIISPGQRQSPLYPTEPAKIKKNEKTRDVPARKKD